MGKQVLEIVKHIEGAVNKIDTITDIPSEMSESILKNRIINLETYSRYIEQQTIPQLEKILQIHEEENNGWSSIL